MKSSSRYFANRDCEYFPCHQNADSDNFNCLFCFCPLYVLGDRCGGSFTYLDNGVKDCSSCLYPHSAEKYERILARYDEIKQILHRPEE